MTTRALAKFLIESELPSDIRVFIDRMLLRIHHAPALMASLLDINTMERDGNQIIQLDFKRLPSEVIPQIQDTLGAPRSRVLNFDSEYGPHTGFEITITPDDLKIARHTSQAALALY